MKAIKVKNQVYELTGERGDFYVAKDNKGKVKMFAKIECEVVEIEKIEKKTYKKSATKTVSDKMNPYGYKIANVSQKQAWILACCAIENDIKQEYINE